MNYLEGKVGEAELETLEFQVDIYQGGMETALVSMVNLVRTLNNNSVGVTNITDHAVTRWHCRGAEQANRCMDAIQKEVEAGAAIPYRLLSRQKETVYVQEGAFPEGSLTAA